MLVQNLIKILKENNFDYLLVNSTNEFLVEYNELEQNARYYLTGLFLHSKCIDDEYFYCGTTTDGHKLAFIKVPQNELFIFSSFFVLF